MGILDDLKSVDREAGNWAQSNLVPNAARGIWPGTAPMPGGNIDPTTGQPPAPPTVEPKEATAVPPNTEFSNDFSERALAEEQFRKDITPEYSGPVGGPGNEVVPGFENFLPAGGKAVWDEINQRGQALGEEIDKGAQAEADKSKALADWYKSEKGRQEQEQAVIRQRHLEDQAQIQAKQQQITEATQRYTQDLADRGQYWRNPGNIIAAFAASLMALGSDDGAIGIKIVNQAVQQDFAQRKAIADTNLGYMKSNLDAYRQIAGDKDLGDRMAFAEANRMAAIEIDRIGQQFQGPIAKAKAAAIKQEFLRNYQVQMAQLHSAMIYNKPQAMPAPIAAKYKDMANANPGEMKPYSPSKGWSAAGGHNIILPDGRRVQAPPGGWDVDVKSGKWITPDGKHVEPQATPASSGGAGVNNAMRKASGGPTSVDKKTEKLYDKRAPGTSSLVESYRERLASNAKRKIAPHYSKEAFDKAVDDQIAEDEKVAGSVAKEATQHSGNIKSWGRFTTDLDKVRQAATRMDSDPDTFLGDMHRLTPGQWAHKIQELRAAWGNKKDPHSAQALEELEASERVHQMIAEKVVDYYHTKFGGAMSEPELNLGRGVIGPSSNFEKIYNFAQNGRRTAGETWGALLSQAGPRAATLLQIRYGQDSPGTNTPGTGKPKSK